MFGSIDHDALSGGLNATNAQRERSECVCTVRAGTLRCVAGDCIRAVYGLVSVMQLIGVKCNMEHTYIPAVQWDM